MTSATSSGSASSMPRSPPQRPSALAASRRAPRGSCRWCHRPLTTPPAGRGVQSYRSVIGEPGQGVPLEGRGGGRGPAGPPAAGAPPAAPAGAPAGAAPPAVAPPGGANPQTPPGAAPGRQGGGGGGGGGGGRGNQGPGIPGAPQTGGGGGLGRASGVVYALSSDGMLHVLGLPSGKDIQKPAPFVPANARWTDTIAVDTTLYATTAGTAAVRRTRCGPSISRARTTSRSCRGRATADRSSAASRLAVRARSSRPSVPAPRPPTAR